MVEEIVNQNSEIIPPNFEEDFLSNIRNCFHLEGNMLLLAMRDLTIVMSDDMETLAITNFKSMFGDEFEGRAHCFKSDSSEDDNSILIGFNDAKIPDHIKSSNIFDGQHSKCDSWIARFIFDKKQKKLVRSFNPEDSVLIKGEVIRSFSEFAPRKLIVSTESNSIILFHDWELNRIYLDVDPSNQKFTQGYLSPAPIENEEVAPFEAANQTDEHAELFALKQAFLDQLEETEGESLREKQEFFIQKEEDGICLNFTSPIKLKNGNTQLNLV